MTYRKHIRLKGYDYATPNYYFVTVCTNFRRELFVPTVSDQFGDLLSYEVVAGPWPAGLIKNTNIVENKLLLLEEKFPIELDFYCMMQDHLHAIIAIRARQGRAATISTIINAFKGWCTRELGYRVFQPNFYEHVIRNDQSLDRVRKYILHNPLVAYSEIPWKLIDPS